MTDDSGSTEIAHRGPVPGHVAIIMDGNNRWARARGQPVSLGHKAGVEAIRAVLRVCERYDIRVLTLFAFSSENWQRPPAEVSALMRLFSSYLNSEVRRLHEDGIRLRFIGRRDRLRPALVKRMEQAERLTADNRRSTLVIAVDYGGHWDLADAARRLARRVLAGDLDPDSITTDVFAGQVASADLPPPDLCIRTAGEQRISNFLLWQLAYSELYFTDTLWPDFSEGEMVRALAAFAARERRYGTREVPVPVLSEASGRA